MWPSPALCESEIIAREVCEPVRHRQFVFTVPKRLRPLFRFDRRLLGDLPRLAWQTVLEAYRAVLDRHDVTPGMIAAIAARRGFVGRNGRPLSHGVVRKALLVRAAAA